jgi:hypothetical protein
MEEPYPGYAEELRKRAEKLDAIERAQSATLPGALREAFGGTVAGEVLAAGHRFVLQPVSLSMAAALERIDSPLLKVVRIMREVLSGDTTTDAKPQSQEERLATVHAKVSALTFESEQVAETIFIFVTPARQVRELLESGRERFREAAMESIGELHPAIVGQLERACAQHYVKSFATVIGYGAPPYPGGGVSFRAPSPREVTDSVGG